MSYIIPVRLPSHPSRFGFRGASHQNRLLLEEVSSNSDYPSLILLEDNRPLLLESN